MKITKKTPLRPRGRSDEKRQSTKDAIREAYANGPQKEVQIIPAKKDLATDAEKKKLRVCAYCRVSTEEDNQASSYELQVQNYTKMIQENPEWEFAGIFADMYNRILIQCPPHGSVEKWLKQRLSADLNRLPKAFFFVS